MSNNDLETPEGLEKHYDSLIKYNPDQPRDEKGRWTAGGEVAAGKEIGDQIKQIVEEGNRRRSEYSYNHAMLPPKPVKQYHAAVDTVNNIEAEITSHQKRLASIIKSGKDMNSAEAKVHDEKISRLKAAHEMLTGN